MKMPSFEQLEQARQEYINNKKRKDVDKLIKEITELSNEILKGIIKMKEEKLKFKDYFKLIKQYPDSGYELGDIVQGIYLSLPAVKNREYWIPIKKKFTRKDIIEIFKKNSLTIHYNRNTYFTADSDLLVDFGLSINDFTK